MKNNKLLIFLSVGLLLTSCSKSYYEGDLKEVRLSKEINYINQYRLNSNLKYKIPLKSSAKLSKYDIKEVLLDDNKIKDFNLETIDESNYKYYLSFDSINSYENIKIKLSNNKIYEYNVNLRNYVLDEYEGDYSFECLDFKKEEGVIDKYKLTYSLKFDKKFGINLHNSNLKLTHPIFNGKASVYDLDSKTYFIVSGKGVNLSKNKTYLIEIEFEEAGFTYYFDEYMPFEVYFNYDPSNCKYIYPQNDSFSYSKILKEIF